MAQSHPYSHCTVRVCKLQLLEASTLYIRTSVYMFSTKWLSSWSARDGSRIRHFVLFVFAWVLCFLSALICAAGHLYMYMHRVYVCLCAYCKHMLSLAAGGAWGHPLQQIHLYGVNQCIRKFLCLQKNSPNPRGLQNT